MKIRVGLGLSTFSLAGWDHDTFWSIVDGCERGGWDSIWFSERVTYDAPDPLVAMAAVAGRTTRLKFGPSVMVLPGRNPVLLAKQLATLDVVSSGRLVAAFGLGVDGRSDREIFGVPREELAGRTDEAVELIRRLWTEENVTFEGRFFRVSEVAIGPKPLQKPAPDVWFGGVSKPALRRVARLGDGWLPSFIAAAEYPEMAATIRTLAGENGRVIDDEHFGALIPYLPDGAGDPEGVLSVVAARRPGVDPRELVVLGGTAELRSHLERFIEHGASKFVVTPVLRPKDWETELATVRAEVAEPLEN
ncbi:MAG TPA: TIGR03619 family F420-dependent LLM class oxidoreductase [Actinomycetota bacterium]|nr:TIGR03619 family F420-dependent LLM class oxidoreductase [Actinomycetota bacterium]